MTNLVLLKSNFTFLSLSGVGKAIDPNHHFIIVPNMFGNGISSSPSNTPPPFDGPNFPHISIYDNVICQHKLLVEKWDIRCVSSKQRKHKTEKEKEKKEKENKTK